MTALISALSPLCNLCINRNSSSLRKGAIRSVASLLSLFPLRSLMNIARSLSPPLNYRYRSFISASRSLRQPDLLPLRSILTTHPTVPAFVLKYRTGISTRRSKYPFFFFLFFKKEKKLSCAIRSEGGGNGWAHLSYCDQ